MELIFNKMHLSIIRGNQYLLFSPKSSNISTIFKGFVITTLSILYEFATVERVGLGSYRTDGHVKIESLIAW